jgi:hypothetical protein
MARVISLAELRRHASPDDAWVAIRGVVYDITDFIASHPGGTALAPALGTVCTNRFVTSHLVDVEKWLRSPSWCACMGIEVVGEIDIPSVVSGRGRYDTLVQWSAQPELFYRTLNRRVMALLHERGERVVGGSTALITITLHLLCWYAAMVQGVWLAALPLGYLTALIGMKIGHSAAHGGFARSRLGTGSAATPSICSTASPTLKPRAISNC